MVFVIDCLRMSCKTLKPKLPQSSLAMNDVVATVGSQQ